jgi:hypothetical protein
MMDAGSFASTVGPEQADDLTVRHGKGDIFKRRVPDASAAGVESAGETDDLDAVCRWSCDDPDELMAEHLLQKLDGVGPRLVLRHVVLD